MSDPQPILVVSACLLGHACRYDGASKGAPRVSEAAERWRAAGGRVVPVCPEELGELGTPRPPADLRGGDGAAVLEGAATVQRLEDDSDVTAAFIEGARRALALAGDAPSEALLKARSPSCGLGQTWIDGQVRAGDGVFAALLRRRGVPCRSDEELTHP